MAIIRPRIHLLPGTLFGLLAALLLLASISAQAAPPGLDVEITGVRSDRGVILIAVFGDAESYELSRDPIAKLSVPAVEGTVTVHLDLPTAGKVAISVFHDENDNGALDTNRIGIPQEGYGFSNGVAGRFGKPGFSKISIDVGEGTTEAGIQINYLF
jgi:uncharacterized protein (DUF2141 family)